MTPYERYIFDGRCPYTNIPCYKECACVNCEVNTHEIEDAEELDMAEGEDKEWEVEATIEIKTSFFCDTKEEAEKEAHKYLEELCTGLYPDCCSNSYEIENIYSYTED